MDELLCLLREDGRRIRDVLKPPFDRQAIEHVSRCFSWVDEIRFETASPSAMAVYVKDGGHQAVSAPTASLGRRSQWRAPAKRTASLRSPLLCNRRDGPLGPVHVAARRLCRPARRIRARTALRLAAEMQANPRPQSSTAS